MQQVILKDVTCIEYSAFNNESEFQARTALQKHIDKFNKESLTNAKQAEMTNKDLLVCFVNKKRLLDIYFANRTYEYNGDDNTLKFTYRHYGISKRFLIEITTKIMEDEQSQQENVRSYRLATQESYSSSNQKRP